MDLKNVVDSYITDENETTAAPLEESPVAPIEPNAIPEEDTEPSPIDLPPTDDLSESSLNSINDAIASSPAAKPAASVVTPNDVASSLSNIGPWGGEGGGDRYGSMISPVEKYDRQGIAQEVMGDIPLNDKYLQQVGQFGARMIDGSMVTEREIAEVSRARSMVAGGAAGITMDSDDEIGALLISRATNRPYAEVHNMLDKQKRIAEAAWPLEYTTTQLTGAVATSVGVGIVAKAPFLAGAIKNMGWKSLVALNATLAAYEGGMSSPKTFGQAPVDVASRAITGGAVGGGLMGGAIGVGSLIKGAAKFTAKKWSGAHSQAIEEYMKRWKELDVVDPKDVEKIRDDFTKMFKHIESEIADGNLSVKEGYEALNASIKNLSGARDDVLAKLNTIDVTQKDANDFVFAYDSLKEKLYKHSDNAVDALKDKKIPADEIFAAFDRQINEVPGSEGLVLGQDKNTMSALESLKKDLYDDMAKRLKERFPNASSDMIEAAIRGKKMPVITETSAILGADGKPLTTKMITEVNTDLKKAAKSMDGVVVKSLLKKLQKIGDGAWTQTAGGHAFDYSDPAIKQHSRELYSKLNKFMDGFEEYQTAMGPARDIAKTKSTLDKVFPQLHRTFVDKSGPTPVVVDELSAIGQLRGIAKTLDDQRRVYIKELERQSGVNLSSSINAVNAATRALSELKQTKSPQNISAIMDVIDRAEKAKMSLAKFKALAPQEIQAELAIIDDLLKQRDTYEDAAGALMDVAEKYNKVAYPVGPRGTYPKMPSKTRFQGVTSGENTTKGLTDLINRLTTYEPDMGLRLSKRGADAEALDAVSALDSTGDLANFRQQLDDISIMREFEKAAPKTGYQGPVAQVVGGVTALAAGPNVGAVAGGAYAMMGQASETTGGKTARKILKTYLRLASVARRARNVSIIPGIEYFNDPAFFYIQKDSPEHQEIMSALRADKDLPASKKIVAMRALGNGFDAKDIFDIGE